MSRVIFSIIPHGWELDVTKRIKPKKVLASYFYLNKMKEEKIKSFFEDMRGQGTETLIDSGVFSLRVKYGSGIFQLNSSFERLNQETKKKVITHYQQYQKDFDKFKDDYIKFLFKWGDYLDNAIDLDVDQFLGVDLAEEYYSDIIKEFPSTRLLRVFHSAYRDFSDWKKWCDPKVHQYLAMEGAGSHSYDPHFYDPFVSYAHQFGIKVHILAMTSVDLLNSVAFDTGDSTTYQVGARFGQIHTPWGFVYISEVGKEKTAKQNYFQLPPGEQEEVRKLVSSHGFSVKAFFESSYETKKSLAGIERSAWNMFFQENYMGIIVAKDQDKQLSIFDV